MNRKLIWLAVPAMLLVLSLVVILAGGNNGGRSSVPSDRQSMSGAGLTQENPKIPGAGEAEAAAVPAVSPENGAAAVPAVSPENEAAAVPAVNPETEVMTYPAAGPENETAAVPAVSPETEVMTYPATGPEELNPSDQMIYGDHDGSDGKDPAGRKGGRHAEEKLGIDPDTKPRKIPPNDTLKVQERLAELGYLNVAYNGYYGDATRLAVKEFQLFNGQKVTGEMDEQTAEEMEKNAARKRRVLVRGRSGKDVALLQEILHNLGFLNEYEEGSFDEQTEAAVQQFQMSNGLDADGSVGNMTIDKILSNPVSREEYQQMQEAAELAAQQAAEEAAQAAQAAQTVTESNPLVRQMASAVLDQVGWDLSAAYYWSVQIPYTREFDGNTSSDAAVFTFSVGAGDCIGKAASFCWMARVLGYNARVIRGWVPMASGDFGDHAWAEIDVDGITYVCDPQFEWDDGLNGYMIQYGQTGTWMYQYDHIMND